MDDFTVCRVVHESLVLPQDAADKFTKAGKVDFVTTHAKDFNPKGYEITPVGATKRAEPDSSPTGAADAAENDEDLAQPPAKCIKIGDSAEVPQDLAAIKQAHEDLCTIGSKTGISLHFVKRASEEESDGVWIESEDAKIIPRSVALGSVGPGTWVEGRKAKDLMEVEGGRWFSFCLASQAALVIGLIDQPLTAAKSVLPPHPIPLQKFLNYLVAEGFVRVRIVGRKVARSSAIVAGEIVRHVSPTGDTQYCMKLEPISALKAPSFNNLWGWSDLASAKQREHLEFVPVVKYP